MCTAATYQTKDFYFGRTLDNDISYGEGITITPRNYPFYFRRMGAIKRHYAMIGMAFITENYPLYFDATNEAGVAMAALNFVGNACYGEEIYGRDNIATFEFIPWILSQCDCVEKARVLLRKLNLINLPFNNDLPVSQLHWIIADSKEAITVESTKDGLHIYDNPVGILTNNPPFDIQMFQLNNYMNLSTTPPTNHFCSKLSLDAYSRGMGALGLPGDLSSQSRFIRASFVKMNSISGDSEVESVNQFFHILGSVDQPRGCCDLGDKHYETTIYTSCCNTNTGHYYYNTYDNHQISMVDMYREDLDACLPIQYPVIRTEQFCLQNDGC